MKIIKYGVVILTESGPKVEGWQVQRELSDPDEATTEELLLEYAIDWARKKFNDAVNSAVMKVYREKLLARLPKKIDFDESN